MLSNRTNWLVTASIVILALRVLRLLWCGHEKFSLTTLICVCICIHALVLIMGGACSDARAPLGFAIQDAFKSSATKPIEVAARAGRHSA